jgi:hypothetical protein
MYNTGGGGGSYKNALRNSKDNPDNLWSKKCSECVNSSQFQK